ncbi:restriction endonuclease subunit S [Aeromonas veronii]
MKKGWVTKTLGEILEKTETTNPTNKPDSEFDYIDVSSVSNITFSVETTQTLKGKDAPSRARKLVRENDVIFATIRPTLKRIAIVPKELDQQICSTGYCVLRAKPEIDHRFLFYSLFTASFMGQMESLQKGASYPAVTEGEVKAQSFSFPPLPEQQRIVAILDEAFEAIAAARTNTEQNRQNARSLFESYLQSVFRQHGNGWVERSFSEVCEISSTLVDPRQDEYLEQLHIGGANIEAKTGKLLELRTAREENLISGKFIFDESMVLYSKIRPYLMKVVRPDFKGLCSADIYPLSPKSGLLDRNYLFHMLLSPQFTDYANAGSARAGMPKVNRGHLFSYRCFFPPIEQQIEFAASLDALHEETQCLESLYQRKIAALDELKQSLLQQAFSGKL